MRGKLAEASQGRSVRFFTTIMQIMFILLSIQKKKKTEWQTFRSISKHVFFSLSRSKSSFDTEPWAVLVQNLRKQHASMHASKQARKQKRKKESSEVSPGECSRGTYKKQMRLLK
jgi:hypothetical protein